MSYNLWITSNQVVGPSLPEGDPADEIRTVAGNYNLQFPNLPPHEKFKLTLKSFQLLEPVTGLVSDPHETQIATLGLNGAGKVFDRTKVGGMSIRIKGFSTQYSNGIVLDKVPEVLLDLGRVDISLLQGTAIGLGNAVNQHLELDNVVERPRAGTYAIEFIGPNGGLVSDLTGGDGGHLTTLGDWRMCLGLVPMTNNEVRDFDGRV
jgi:hypothetical protein